MDSSANSEGQLNLGKDQPIPYDAQFEIVENIRTLDFGHHDGASEVQALLHELEAGLGFVSEVVEHPVPFGVGVTAEFTDLFSKRALNLDPAMEGRNGEGPSASDSDTLSLSIKGVSEAHRGSRYERRKEVIDLTAEEDEGVPQISAHQLRMKKRDPEKTLLRGPSLPFSPSLVANIQIPENPPLIAHGDAVQSHLSAQGYGGELVISPLLPNPITIPMDTLWDFSASQPPGPLHPGIMPELMAPQPRRRVQDFQVPDQGIPKPVGLGILMDSAPVEFEGSLGWTRSTQMEPINHNASLPTTCPPISYLPGGTELALRSNVSSLPQTGGGAWGELSAQSLAHNSLDTVSATEGSFLGPAFAFCPASPTPVPGVRTTRTSQISPKKQTKTSASSWPDFVMAHYNPRSYSNPPVLHGSPIKVKQSEAPIRGSDLKILSARYPFPSKGEAKAPDTPEKKRKVAFPDTLTFKATPSPTRPPNIGQSRKVVQAFAAQRAERNEERARTGSIGPASLKKEKTSRKREKPSGDLRGHEAEQRGTRGSQSDAEKIATLSHIDWTIFGDIGAEPHSGITAGGPGSASLGAMIQDSYLGLPLTPVDELASMLLAASGTSSGIAPLVAPQPLFDYPLALKPPISLASNVPLPSHLGTLGSAVWSAECVEPLGQLLPSLIPESLGTLVDEGGFSMSRKRTIGDEDDVEPAAKRIRI